MWPVDWPLASSQGSHSCHRVCDFASEAVTENLLWQVALPVSCWFSLPLCSAHVHRSHQDTSAASDWKICWLSSRGLPQPGPASPCHVADVLRFLTELLSAIFSCLQGHIFVIFYLEGREGLWSPNDKLRNCHWHHCCCIPMSHQHRNSWLTLCSLGELIKVEDELSGRCWVGTLGFLEAKAIHWEVLSGSPFGEYLLGTQPQAWLRELKGKRLVGS